MCVISTTVALSLLCALVTTTTNADVPRPRGVSLPNASLYHPIKDNKWTCLDGSRTIQFTHINDDYCDCADGSDEPGTSACPQGQYHCENIGHRPQSIPSSKVNDGICDCCDGSDEYDEITCPNTCQELGRAELEFRKSKAELHKRGATKRAELITKSKQLRAERDSRRIELNRRRSELDALKAEKDELKKQAEANEAEAVELFKEQQREQEAESAPVQNEDSAQLTRAEAEATFMRYDATKDGFIEVTELQVDMTLDRDHNGVVTVEEAKYFLDERDRIDFDGFMTLSWPRIKTAQMLAQGIFKPPVQVTDGEEDPDNDEHEEDEHDNDKKSDEEHEHPEDYEPEDGEGYEDDPDTGVGSVTPDTTPTPVYDPATQQLIDLANEARNAHAQVERELREVDNELKDIDDQNAKDYGPHEEYAAMDGECYKFEDREYVYTLCLFDRTAQKQRSGGAETTLGRWDQWIGEGENKYAKQRYSHGASCWNGPQRSAVVHLKCALEHKIISVSEPNRCEYNFEFETPAACHQIENATNDEALHDEL